MYEKTNHRRQHTVKVTHSIATERLRTNNSALLWLATYPRASDLELGRVGGLVVLDLHRLRIATARTKATTFGRQKNESYTNAPHFARE